jgi:hypothetical protein
LNNLVGSGQQRFRDGEAEGFVKSQYGPELLYSFNGYTAVVFLYGQELRWCWVDLGHKEEESNTTDSVACVFESSLNAACCAAIRRVHERAFEAEAAGRSCR